MKSKDKKTMSDKSINELQAQLKEARDELFSLRLDKAQNKLKNTRSLFLKRKEIAYVLTLIREKELMKGEE